MCNKAMVVSFELRSWSFLEHTEVIRGGLSRCSPSSVRGPIQTQLISNAGQEYLCYIKVLGIWQVVLGSNLASNIDCSCWV